MSLRTIFLRLYLTYYPGSGILRGSLVKDLRCLLRKVDEMSTVSFSANKIFVYSRTSVVSFRPKIDDNHPTEKSSLIAQGVGPIDRNLVNIHG